MITVYSDQHEGHRGAAEPLRGRSVPCFESPERAVAVLEEIGRRRLGEVIQPRRCELDDLLRAHDRRFLEFLQNAWTHWQREGREGDALPSHWPVGRWRGSPSESIDGLLGHYAGDACTPITAGTWSTAMTAAAVALDAAGRVADGAASAFGLCRPPGHHAGADFYGGYCFLNNAALAALRLLDRGAARVAILDVDYHHGHGTQSIFYARNDVLYVSLHCDPRVEYPYYYGYSNERGEGAGAGFNRNFPLAGGTDGPTYLRALEAAVRGLSELSPDGLVVSLGVDTHADDPLANPGFRLRDEHYLELGRLVARVAKPTVFILEGGYAIGSIGRNVVDVLSGFEGA